MISETETFYPKNRRDWRKWLKKNHQTHQSIWLIYYKKQSNVPSISYSDAVDEALCFGWIDSTKKTRDAESYIQFFCKRKANSVWSKINKEKIARLSAEGLMEAAGLASIERAKENGSWSIMDDVEELIIPKDLSTAFKKHPGAKAYFEGLSKSMKKQLLHWVTMAKRAETREKRIKELASLAAIQQKPKQFI